MKRRLERAWVGFLDSPRWRRLSSGPVGRRLMGGAVFRSLNLRRRRLLARVSARRQPDLASDVETICLFVGHVKSGGSLIGAMIDAHPDALIADEVDALDHLAAGFTRQELLAVMAKVSRREAMKGRVTARRLQAYSLAIDDQWQGRHRRALVIGESRAGPTTRKLGADPDRLEELVRFAAPARLRFIHVIRNPLDPIAAMVVRGGRSVEGAIDDYAAQAERAESIVSQLAPDDLLAVHYETLLERPTETVESVFGFLGLEPDRAVVAACAALIDPTREPERQLVEWTPAQLDQVHSLIHRHPFLDRYSDEIDLERGRSRSWT
jgi:hypothetical protein